MNRKEVIEDLVTIVVPAYNAETFLRENIESILGQTYKNLEVIYVCDGCTDDTVKILEEYKTDKRLQIVVQEKNQGAAISRNIGMDMATGDWIIFFDADDVFESDMIEVMLCAAIENNADMVGCYWEYFDNVPLRECAVHNEMKKLMCTTYPMINTQKDAKQIMQVVDHSPCVKLVHKSIYKKQEVYFQDLPNTNDVYYSIVAGMNSKKIVFVDKVLLHYRSNRGRVTLSTYRREKRSYSLEAFDKIYEYIVSEGKNEKFLQSFYNAVIGNLLGFSVTPLSDYLVEQFMNKYLDKWGMRVGKIENKLSCVNKIVYRKLLNKERKIGGQEIYRCAKLELVKSVAEKGGSIWGTGQQGEELFKEIEGMNIRFRHVFDSNANKWGIEFHGYCIENFDEVKADYIIVTTSLYFDEIKARIGNRAEHVYNLHTDMWKI